MSEGPSYTPSIEELCAQPVSDVKCAVDGCGKVFKHNSALQMHLVQTHKLHGPRKYGHGSEIMNKMKIFHCPVSSCKYHKSRSFKNKDSIHQHYLKVHGEKKFTCDKCTKRFGMKRLLVQHEKTCGVVFTCTECRAPYATSEALRTHMVRKHSPVTESQSHAVANTKSPAPVHLKISIEVLDSAKKISSSVQGVPIAKKPKLCKIAPKPITDGQVTSSTSSTKQTSQQTVDANMESHGTQTDILKKIMQSCQLDLSERNSTSERLVTDDWSQTIEKSDFSVSPMEVWPCDISTQTLESLIGTTDMASQCFDPIPSDDWCLPTGISAPIMNSAGTSTVPYDNSAVYNLSDYASAVSDTSQLLPKSMTMTFTTSQVFPPKSYQSTVNQSQSSCNFATQTTCQQLAPTGFNSNNYLDVSSTTLVSNIRSNTKSLASQSSTFGTQTSSFSSPNDDDVSTFSHLDTGISTTRGTNSTQTISSQQTTSSIELQCDLDEEDFPSSLLTGFIRYDSGGASTQSVGVQPDLDIRNSHTTTSTDSQSNLYLDCLTDLSHSINESNSAVQSTSDFAMQYAYPYELNDFGTQTVLGQNYTAALPHDSSIQHISDGHDVLLSQSSTQTDLDFLFCDIQTQT